MTHSPRPKLEIVRHSDEAPDLPLPVDEPESDREEADDMGAELEPAVIEGEIVSDKPQRSAGLPSVVVDRITVLRTSPTTTKVALTLAQHGALVLVGWHAWIVRLGGGLTDGVIREQIRAAKALGNDEKLAFWLDKRRDAKNDRHERLLKLPLLALKMAALAGGCMLGVLVLLVIVATIVWMTGAGDWTDLWVWLGGVFRWLFGAVTVAWWVFAFTWPAWFIVLGWREGNRNGGAPAWIDKAAARNTGSRDRIAEPVLITPSIVVTALRDMGYGPLRQSIRRMGDAGAAMLGTINLAGCGVEVDVALPSGTSTDEVEKRRRKLAENLGRHVHELFITVPKRARTVRLWIADPGALDEPIGPSPLVTATEIEADYEKGRAPWGENLRGEAVGISLFQRHLLITGLSNQGKTASLRALALWLAFVLNVRFYIADLKGVGDWAMFDGMAEVLIQGPTDDHVARATEMVEWGVSEMERRLQAPPGTKFDPAIIIVDEAQQAFMCPAREEYITDDGKVKQGAPYGGTKATSRYFMATRKLHNQGRAVDVLLWQGTQDPTDQNLPKLVREGAHIRASLVVGTEAQAKMALGDKAVDGGAAPHLLRQDLDKGTVVTNGGGMKLPAGQSSITIRTHFVDTPEAIELAGRAKALRNGTATRDGVPVEEKRVDPLVDIAAILGDEPRMLTQEVLQRLAARNPGLYRTWTPGDLKEFLDDAGAPSYKSEGRMVVGRARVLRALGNREESPPEEDA